MKKAKKIVLLVMASGIIAACNVRMAQPALEPLTGNTTDKASLSGDYYFKIQEYENAIKKYGGIVNDKKAKPIDIHLAKLQLARVYYETRQFEKAQSLYADVIEDNLLEGLIAKDVNNYLDILCRCGAITKAHLVAARFRDMMSDTRFKNRCSSINKYESFLTQRFDTLGRYGLEDLGGHAEMVRLNVSVTGYQYGASPYKDGIVFLANYVTENRAKTLYVNSRMYYQDKKGLSEFNKSLDYILQAGPAVFYDNEKSIIYTTNRYGKISNEKTLNTLVVNELQLVTAQYNANTGKWSPPTRISHWAGKNSSEYSFMHPTLSADAKRLYFASNMPGGYGGSDIYYADWNNEKKEWGQAVNLGAQINTNGDELFPQLFNGDKLLFSSNGQEGYGSQDIYVADLKNNNPSIVHLPYPVNTQYDDVNPVFLPAQDVFYLASDRPGNNLKDRIYKLDMLTHPLIELGYKPLEKKKEKVVKDTRILTEETPSDVNVKRVMPSYLMHFDFNKYNLKNEDMPYLQDIIANYSAEKYIIQIDGYTDGIGGWNYNMLLSRKRSESVKQYLVKGGVPENQIIANAHGADNFKITCDTYVNKVECIKLQGENRRCEINIFEKE